MRALVRILIAFVLVAALVLVGGWMYLRSKLEPMTAQRLARAQKAMADHRAAFFADQEWAATLDVLTPVAGEDAGPFLNPRLRWTGHAPSVARWSASLPVDQPKLALDEPAATAARGEWLETDPAVLEKVDFAWMSKLQSFGSWDLETGSPQAAGVPFDRLDAPLPDFQELALWARLRLARGVRDGQGAQAAAEIRHLARLELTTESLLGAMHAVALLRLEARAHSRAVQLGQPVEGWTPLGEASALRLKRVLFATPAFAAVDAPAAAREDFARLKVGRCEALSEATTLGLMVRPLLGGPNDARLASIARHLDVAKECRLVSVRRLWAAPDDPSRALVSSEVLCGSASPSVACELSRRLAWLPGFRALAGQAMLDVATPNWFASYEEHSR